MTEQFDAVVVGSGPGGSVTADVLSAAGYHVLVLEEGEGSDKHAASAPAYSMTQLRDFARHGGGSVALGSVPIAYAEGRCVGGGSRINAGLYHRPPADVLQRWQERYGIENLLCRELDDGVERAERDLHLSKSGKLAPDYSQRLADGAAALGWKAMEVPRWIESTVDENGRIVERRWSMRETVLARALESGATLWKGARATRICIRRGRVEGVLVEKQRSGITRFVQARTVIAACGAIESPSLLLQSGIRGNVGKNLKLHPTVKIIARFDETVNSEPDRIGSHQIHQFMPGMLMGCAVSSPSFLAAGIADAAPEEIKQIREEWRCLASYYAMIVAEGHGRVRVVPGLDDPIVTFRLTRADIIRLSQGMAKLAEVLLASGAKRLYPSARGGKPVQTLRDMEQINLISTIKRARLMTIHLAGTCRMGQDRDAVTDSFGRVHGVNGLYVNDCSVLPSTPGVNPQGTVMAIAYRNAVKMVEALQ